MINHARNLLLNQSHNSRPTITFYGEEYVDKDYIPKTITGDLSFVRQNIMGITSDNAFANFRLAQYFNILHSNPYGDYFVKNLDSRITYDKLNKKFFLYGYGNTLNTTDGITVVNPDVDMSLGLMYYAWTVDYLGPSNIQVTNNASGITETITSLSGYIPNTKVYFEITDTSKSPWTCTTLLRPTNDLKDKIDYMINLPEKLAESIFISEDEPYRTFADLWVNHPIFSYRFVGILLGLIYAIDAL